MGHQVCHAHCPSGGGGLGAVVALAAAGGAISAVLGAILWTAGIITAVLIVAGTWYLVRVLRRDRLPAPDVAAPPGRRLDAPLIAQQRQGLPDGSLGKPVLLSQRVLAGEPARDVPAIDAPAQVIGELAPGRRRAVQVDDHDDNGS